MIASGQRNLDCLSLLIAAGTNLEHKSNVSECAHEKSNHTLVLPVTKLLLQLFLARFCTRTGSLLAQHLCS